ncbi:DUF7507 domain-containing protein, partial [Nonlabens tegetincola]|uniref:DUF7507 domain-containing protein n=1 Tax=Nonlabens tegetincola TaxID=323273 RepID=UPI0005AB0F76
MSFNFPSNLKFNGNIIYVLLLLFILNPSSVFADGTKQLMPSATGVEPANGTALYITRGQFGPYVNAPNSSRLRFTIANAATENLYFGVFSRQRLDASNHPELGAFTYYRIYDQSGTLVEGVNPAGVQVGTLSGRFDDGAGANPIAGDAGFVSNYTEAFNGPNGVGGVTNGYNPYVFNPTTAGNYYIEFYISTDGGATPFTFGNGDPAIFFFPYFDFTVGSTASAIPGRIWSDKWSLIGYQNQDADGDIGTPNVPNPTLDASVEGEFYAYTDDQVIVKVDFLPGFRPLAYELSMNRFGVVDDDDNPANDFLLTRRSVNRPSNTSPNLDNGYPVFLTVPDQSVFVPAPQADPILTGEIFGCPGNYYIPYTLDAPADVALLVDFDGNGVFDANTRDVVIEAFEQPVGDNLLFWDGLDGFGDIAEAGVSISLKLVSFRGRTNVPMYDAEFNLNGLTMESVTPTLASQKLFWDDSQLTAFGTCVDASTQNTANTTTGSFVNTNLLNGNVGPGHAWNGSNPGNTVPATAGAGEGTNTPTLLCDDYGNIRVINTWFYGSEVESSVVQLVVPSCDQDGDGVHDLVDIDDDNDGIPDIVELENVNANDPLGDDDGDGLLNYFDPSNGPGTDGPSSSNFVDNNNDGVSDLYDTDGDGIIDQFDLDADGDGVPDNVEAQGTLGYIAQGSLTDTDGDGLVDTYDPDCNGSSTTSASGNAVSGFTYGGNQDITPALGTPEANGVAATNLNGVRLRNTGSAGETQGPLTLEFDRGLPVGTTITFSIANDIGAGDSMNITLGSQVISNYNTGGAADSYVQFNVITTSSTSSVFFELNSGGFRIGGVSYSFTSATCSNGFAVLPVDTDFDGVPDYKDLDSDNDSINDTTENNFALSGNDTDFDGLDDSIDATSGYQDPNGNINNPSSLPDNDGDVNGGGDVNYRDTTASVDSDNDGIFDEVDLDDDNDGILDSDECYVEPTATGPYTSTNTTFSFSGSGGNNNANLQSVTLDGITYNDFIVPDLYTENFNSTSDNVVYEVLNGTSGQGTGPTGDNISNPNWEQIILPAFQSRNFNYFQGLSGAVLDTDFYTLSYNVPISVSGESFLLVSERDGNNTFEIEAFDAQGNSFGQLNVVLTDYINTGINTSIGQPINIAVYPLSQLAPAGSVIKSINISPGADGDGGDGKVFILNGGSTCPDTDGDGIIDSLDVDADNDGIYDAVEAGHNEVNTDGRLTGPVGDDGVPNSVQDPGDVDNGIVNYELVNSDGIDNFDFQDTDSDNDGCSDANEAYNNSSADGGDGGAYGSGIPPTNSSNGAVLAASYAQPADSNSNTVPDYTEIGPDTDGDGIIDACDDVDDRPDTDGDGVPNVVDIDDDNDGILDVVECKDESTLDWSVNTWAAGTLSNSYSVDSRDVNITVVDPNDALLNSPNLPISGAFYQGGQPSVPQTLISGFDLQTLGATGTVTYTIDFNSESFNNVAFTLLDVDGELGSIRRKERYTITGFNGASQVLPNIVPAGTQEVIGNSVLGVDPVAPTGAASGAGNVNISFSAPVDTITIVFDVTDDSVINPGSEPGFSIGNIRFSSCDFDNDGVQDLLDQDSDNDGIADNVEAQDTAGYIQPSGIDSDGNGLDDAYETTPGSGEGLTPENTDGDPSPDYVDLDSDNDNVPDATEGSDFNNDGNPDTTPSGNDIDNDGLDDAFDGDTTGYGDPNGTPVTNDPGNELNNTDGTDQPDYRDTDDDNDSLLTSGTGEDTNNDNDPTNDDEDLDGVPNYLDQDDTDGDGVPDTVDIDDDNDGILDINEDANLDGDNNPFTNPSDQDGDGIPNHLDLDSDGDGIPDNNEAQTTLGYIDPLVNDADGDGIPDVTANGLPTAYNQNNDELGLLPVNTDTVDLPDYLDLNSDNQGGNDTVEAGLTLSGNDSDNDGLDDAVDQTPTYADPNGNIDDTANLPDTDGDLNSGGNVDFRDRSLPNDEDGDGVVDRDDLDDDNDGITDITEGFEFYTDNSTTCTGQTYNFNGGTLISGTAGQVGARYRFSGVRAGIDAIVEITQRSTGATLNSIDNASGDANAWQPVINYSAASSGDLTVTFNVQLVDAGTTNLTVVNRISGFIQDVDSDGSGRIREFYRLRNLVGYSLNNPTNIIATNLTGGVTQFRANGTGSAPIEPIDTDARYKVFFQRQDVNQFEYVIGVTKNINAAQSRFYSVQFDECVIDDFGGEPTVVIINAPDLDGDGIPNHLDPDSDGDGCSDTVEAGFIDAFAKAQEDGILGNLAPETVNSSNGLVTSGESGEGYTEPADLNSNGTPDFLEAGFAEACSTQLEITKTSTFDPATGVISYTYIVQNIGSSFAFDVTVSESAGLFTGANTPLPNPAYQSGGTNEDGEGDAIDLRPGASATFTAVYTINQQDINSGQVDNQAIANAVDDNGDPISDISDDGNDGDGNTQDDITETILGSGNLEGVVYNDINGNGTFDTGDVLLSNVDVVITPTNGDPITVQTNASGQFTATVLS